MVAAHAGPAQHSSAKTLFQHINGEKYSVESEHDYRRDFREESSAPW